MTDPKYKTKSSNALGNSLQHKYTERAKADKQIVVEVMPDKLIPAGGFTTAAKVVKGSLCRIECAGQFLIFGDDSIAVPISTTVGAFKLPATGFINIIATDNFLRVGTANVRIEITEE